VCPWSDLSAKMPAQKDNKFVRKRDRACERVERQRERQRGGRGRGAREREATRARDKQTRDKEVVIACVTCSSVSRGEGILVWGELQTPTCLSVSIFRCTHRKRALGYGARLRARERACTLSRTEREECDAVLRGVRAFSQVLAARTLGSTFVAACSRAPADSFSYTCVVRAFA
jgi:hypothetical protein